MTGDQPPAVASPLTKGQVDRLVASALVAHGAGGISQQALERALAWAAEVRGAAALLDLVLTGDVLVIVGDDELHFRKPSAQDRESFRNLLATLATKESKPS